MPGRGFTNQYRTLGILSAWTVSSLLVLYIIALSLGLLSLESPQDPIADPYSSILEILILLVAPLLVILMASVHAYASSEDKAFSLSALIFMILLAGITSAVHFVVLTVSRQIEAAGLSGASFLFSYEWPSVIYTLDILAWDWFFSLSMLFAAVVFKIGRLEKTLRTIMIISGVLSLAGLIGVPLANVNVRNIGIVGYTVVALVAFVLMGIVFWRNRPVQET
jgi:hypothetical protein